MRIWGFVRVGVMDLGSFEFYTPRSDSKLRGSVFAIFWDGAGVS